MPKADVTEKMLERFVRLLQVIALPLLGLRCSERRGRFACGSSKASIATVL